MPYSQRLQGVLQTLSKCKKQSDCKDIFQTINRDIVRLISDACVNIINGRVFVSVKAKRNLWKNRLAVGKLASKGVDYTQKTKIIKQKGGFLIPIIAAAVSALVGSLIT
jgi:hypothetical protein